MENQPLSASQPRALEKCVDLRALREWVPEPLHRQVDLNNAWHIIKKHYCAALVGRGVCPQACAFCRETLVSLFGFDHAQKPEALLTWRAKDRSAAMIERLIEMEKNGSFPSLETPDNPLDALFPRKRGDNLFLELAKDYE